MISKLFFYSLQLFLIFPLNGELSNTEKKEKRNILNLNLISFSEIFFIFMDVPFHVSLKMKINENVTKENLNFFNISN